METRAKLGQPMTKKLLLGAASAIVMTGAAMAADLGVRAPLVAVPVFTWTGFYVGANVGYINSDNGSTQGTGVILNSGLTNATGAASALAAATTGGTKGLSAIMGGGQLGYNYQIGAYVIGIETDLQATSRSNDTRTFDTLLSATEHDVGTASHTQRYNYIGTVRGRIGYLITPSFLLFATGGLAYGEKQDSTAFQVGRVNGNIPQTSGVVSRTSTNTGWVLGGGVEYALDANWSVKGEGMYYDMGRHSANGTITQLGSGGTTPFVASNIQGRSLDRGVIARFGLNYKFTTW